MNTKQLATAKVLTSKLAGLIENANFTVETSADLDGKPVMISASNIGAPWYVQSEFFLAFIGPQGGLKIREGSAHIRKMI